MKRVALWIFLLLAEPVHLSVFGALECVHHVGHHPGQEEGHHVTSQKKVELENALKIIRDAEYVALKAGANRNLFF